MLRDAQDAQNHPPDAPSASGLPPDHPQDPLKTLLGHSETSKTIENYDAFGISLEHPPKRNQHEHDLKHDQKENLTDI